MTRRRLLAALCAALAWPGTAAAGSSSVGTSGGEFLKLGGDARGAAMGEAMTAASEDAAALYYNPAGLSQVQRRQGTGTEGLLYQDVSVSYAAYAHPVTSAVKPRRRFLKPSGLGTLGLGILYLNAGEITEADNTGAQTGGAFTPRDVAISAGWGGTLTELFDLGMALKYVDTRIQATAKTGAVDAGARLRLELAGMPYTAAFVIRNLGGQLRYHQQRDPLPVDVRLGQAVRPTPNLLFSLDVAFPRDNDWYPSFGAEGLVPIDKDVTVAGRAGYDGRISGDDLDGLAGFSLGAGLLVKGWNIDYGWVPFGALGHTHRFSLAYRF